MIKGDNSTLKFDSKRCQQYPFLECRILNVFHNSQLTTKRYWLRFVQDRPSSVVFSREMSLCKTHRLSLTASLLAAVFNRISQTPTTKKIGPSPYPSKQRTLTLDSNRVALHSVSGYTDMRRLMTGIRSEKFVVRRFRLCANVTVYLHKPRQYRLLHT
jgi:hypothetical protein